MDIQTTLYTALQNDVAAHTASEALAAAGGRVYIVGGAVRDAVLDKPHKDVDLMVTGLDERAIREVLSSIPGYVTFKGKSFGVFHYHLDKSQVEIAMPRKEVSTGAGHTDFAVDANPNISVEEDMGRRDFTANAMAFDIDTGRLVDPFGGKDDIANNTLRLVSKQSFKDDPLRIVRAIVSYAVHGLKPDEFTLQEMTDNAARIRHLPDERIEKELTKLLSGSDPAGALKIAYETGVLEYIMPELEAAWDFDQRNPHHDLSVGDHTMAVLRHMATITNDPDLRLSAVLHDLGKPDTFWLDDQGQGHYYKTDDVPGSEDHEDRGADIARELMKRLKYPNDRIARVTKLVQQHMFPYYTSEKGARKFLNQAGSQDVAQDLFKLRESDAHGKSSGEMSEQDAEHLDVSRALLDKVVNRQHAVHPSNLAINGKDIIDLGFQPGPTIGKILNDLMEYVIENPDANDRDTLLQYVRSNYDGNN